MLADSAPVYRRLNEDLAAGPADVEVFYTEQHAGGLKCPVIDEIAHVQAVRIVIAHCTGCSTAIRARSILHGRTVGGPLDEPFIRHTRGIRFRGHVESDATEIDTRAF